MYGFDILVDDDLKPWLLEVNLSPSLGCDSPIDLRVKSSMMSDLLTLVGLPAVDPSSTTASSTNGSQNGGGATADRPRAGRARTAPMTTERKQFRRAASADTGPRSRLTFQSASQQQQKQQQQQQRNIMMGSGTSTLTAEETRILNQLREDFERRGDFNRIFPTEETWSVYGDFIESLSSSPALASPGVNYNRMLHERLFPPPPVEEPSVTSSLAATVVSAAAKFLPSSVVCGSNNTTSSGGSSSKQTGFRNRSAAFQSASSLRIQSVNWSHPSWRSLNEESSTAVDGGEESSYYEQAILQPITIESRRRFGNEFNLFVAFCTKKLIILLHRSRQDD